MTNITKRKKRSVIWTKLTDDEFRELVETSTSYKEMLDFFGLSAVSGGNYKTLKVRVAELDIDVKHIDDQTHKKTFPPTATPLDEIMVENSTYNRSHLKNRLISGEVIKYVCSICGQVPFWNDKDMILILDHINGINNDHRLENLRFVCPNCNVQLDTHAGKRLKKSTKYKCEACGGPKSSKQSKRCAKCSANKQRRVARPSLDQLLKCVDDLGYCGAGRKYGVSDAAIRKWIKAYRK